MLTRSNCIATWGKALAPLAVFLALGLVAYPRVFGLGFLADDAWAFYYSQGSWFIPNAESPHYPALHFAIYYLFYQIFHLNPLPYHIGQFGLVVLNACLVKNLARNLDFEPWQGWLAGILVLVNAVAAEAYLWLTLINTVLMTTLIILGLICLARYRRSGSRWWAAGYLAMVLLAPMLDGKGLILPVLGYFLDRFYLAGDRMASRPLRPGSGIKLHLPAFGVLAALLLLRLLVGVKSATIHLPLAQKWRTLKTTLTTTFFHGLDLYLWDWLRGVPAIWKLVAPYLWWLLVALLVLGLLYQRGGRERRRFLALVLLWVTSCLPHTLAANLQFRYFYLPGVFAALVLVELLGTIHRRLPESRRAWLLISLICLGYLYMDLRGFYLAQNSFQEASQIYDAGLAKIRQRLPALPPGTQLLLVDFPFYLFNQQGGGAPRPDNIAYVYVYPQALPYHLWLLYGTEDFGVTFVWLSAPVGANPRLLGEQISEADLQRKLAQPGVKGFRFLPGKPPRFVQLEPGRASGTSGEAQIEGGAAVN